MQTISKQAPVDLSIVVACYNGTKILEKGVNEICRVLDQTQYKYEIVFVDDASTDNTPQIVKELAAKIPNARAIFHQVNTGRGKTVADGIRESKGTVAGFIDIDLATSAIYIPEFVNQILNGADMCMAWRIYRVTPRIAHRWILSRGYHFLMNAALRVPILDSETGCKFFNREKILPVLDQTEDPHWFWDTEICVRAYYHGLKIVELPTLYLRKPEAGTTVKIFRDSLNYLKNLAKFYPVAKELHRQSLLKKNEPSNLQSTIESLRVN